MFLLTLEREKRRERKRNIDVRNIGRLPSACLYWGLSPQSRPVPLWGREPTTFWYMWWHSTIRTTPARAHCYDFNLLKLNWKTGSSMWHDGPCCFCRLVNWSSKTDSKNFLYTLASSSPWFVLYWPHLKFYNFLKNISPIKAGGIKVGSTEMS